MKVGALIALSSTTYRLARFRAWQPQQPSDLSPRPTPKIVRPSDSTSSIAAIFTGHAKATR
jgi:hypothetical protein